MTFRTWSKLAWTSLGTSAVVAAAQLGVCDELGVLRWGRGASSVEAPWSSQLAWVAFLFSGAVLAGAAVGQRMVRRPGRTGGFGTRLTASVMAGVGAAAVLPLVWLASQGARPPVRINAQLTVAATGIAAIVAGIVLAMFALSMAPFAGNLIATVSWVWLSGISTAVLSLHNHTAGPRPGVLEMVHLADPTGRYVRIFTMSTFALVFGILVAAVARWGGVSRASVALSGAAGPVLLASSYAIAGPGRGVERAGQLDLYLGAMFSVGVGLAGSMLVALVRRARSGVPPAGPAPYDDPYPDPGVYPGGASHRPVSPAPYYPVSPGRPVSPPRSGSAGRPVSPARPSAIAPMSPVPVSPVPVSPAVQIPAQRGSAPPAQGPAKPPRGSAKPAKGSTKKLKPAKPVKDDRPKESARSRRQVNEYEGWLQELNRAGPGEPTPTDDSHFDPAAY